MNRRDEMESEILEAIEDDANLSTLYDVWTLLRRSPSKAVEILMQFKDVSSAANNAVDEIQNALDRFSLLKPRMSELSEGIKELVAFNRSVTSLDDDLILNKLSRLSNMGSHLSKLKTDGTFEMLMTLMKKQK